MDILEIIAKKRDKQELKKKKLIFLSKNIQKTK